MFSIPGEQDADGWTAPVMALLPDLGQLMMLLARLSWQDLLRWGTLIDKEHTEKTTRYIRSARRLGEWPTSVVTTELCLQSSLT